MVRHSTDPYSVGQLPGGYDGKTYDDTGDEIYMQREWTKDMIKKAHEDNTRLEKGRKASKKAHKKEREAECKANNPSLLDKLLKK